MPQDSPSAVLDYSVSPPERITLAERDRRRRADNIDALSCVRPEHVRSVAVQVRGVLECGSCPTMWEVALTPEAGEAPDGSYTVTGGSAVCPECGCADVGIFEID